MTFKSVVNNTFNVLLKKDEFLVASFVLSIISRESSLLLFSELLDGYFLEWHTSSGRFPCTNISALGILVIVGTGLILIQSDALALLRYCDAGR